MTSTMAHALTFLHTGLKNRMPYIVAPAPSTHQGDPRHHVHMRVSTHITAKQPFTSKFTVQVRAE